MGLEMAANMTSIMQWFVLATSTNESSLSFQPSNQTRHGEVELDGHVFPEDEWRKLKGAVADAFRKNTPSSSGLGR